MTWEDLRAWSKRVDDRDMPDAARHWAQAEREYAAMPKEPGEWVASMEMAFAAGMQWGRRGER